MMSALFFKGAKSFLFSIIFALQLKQSKKCRSFC